MSAKKRKEKELQAARPAVDWRLPMPALGFVFAAWALFVVLYFTQQSAARWEYLGAMADQLANMRLFNGYLGKALAGSAAALWIGWVACALGAACLNRLLPPASLSSLERWAWGGTLGFGLLAHGTLLLGALRLWYPAVFFAILLGLAAFFAWRNPFRAPAEPVPATKLPWMGVWVVLLVLLGLIFLWGCLAPEIFFDSLHYHLAVPNLYRMAHRVFDIPTSLYSNFIMTVQMVWGLAITIGNTITAKMLHGLFSLLALAAFIAFGRRYFSPGSGILAALLFLSMPMIGNNLTTAGTDIAWSAIQFVAAAALVRALLEPAGPRWLWIAGALTGISASCKFPAFPYIPVGGLLVLWWRRWDQRLSWKEAIADALHFTIPALLFVAPVLLKSLIWHGNPLYPFGGTAFGHPRIDPKDWGAFYSDTAPRTVSDEFQNSTRALHFLLHPWFLTLAGDHSGDLLGPLNLLALPLLFLIRRPRPAFVILRRYAIILWLLWLCTSTVPRYGSPALALMAPLFAEGLLLITDSFWVRLPVLGSVAYGLAHNALFLLMLLFQMGGWTVTGGLAAEDAYLGQMHATYPTPPYDGIVWMNGHLAKGSKVLFTGDSRSYYLQHPAIMHSIPGRAPLVDWSNEAPDAAALAARLRREGVTHIFLNLAEAVRTDAYDIFHWDARSWAVFQNFWGHYVKLVWNEQNNEPKALFVYELLSDSEAAQPHAAPANPFERWAPK